MNKITINKTTYPIKFGYNAIVDYCGDTNIELDEFLKLIVEKHFTTFSIKQLKDISLLTFYMIKNGCRIENLEFDLTVETILEFIGDDKDKVMISIFNEIISGMGKLSGEKNDSIKSKKKIVKK